jgi:hypothetical protein
LLSYSGDDVFLKKEPYRLLDKEKLDKKVIEGRKTELVKDFRSLGLFDWNCKIDHDEQKRQ